jgi:hypothetical protein
MRKWLVFTLTVLVTAVSCEGPKGPAGEPGPKGGSCTVKDNGDGSKIIICDDGSTVLIRDGQPGGSCSVVDNGDGTKTITCSDGTSVTIKDGQQGASCTITDNGDGTKTITCPDGTSVTIGEGGASTASIELHLLDADSHADIIGAVVVSSPLERSSTSGADGRARFDNLPAGVYTFTVSATALRLEGDTMVPAGEVKVASEPLSLVAGAVVKKELTVTRLDGVNINLITLHTASQPSYKVENCHACHNDRRGELSDDPQFAPWHALQTHSRQACTSCHRTVDLQSESGANIRRQVDVSLCQGCHPGYPDSF